MPRWLVSAVVLVLATSMSCASSAASVRPRPLRIPGSAAPTFIVYSSRDGLSDEIWSTVGFDAAGFVWAGSASALARFDGYRWTTLQDAPGHSLVRDMASDADGNLWAIFEREGLARYDGRTWRQLGAARFYQRFSTIGSGSGRELWVAHNSGLSRLGSGGWIEEPIRPQQAIGRPVAYARTETLFGGPREWLASADSGLWFRERAALPGRWQRFDQPPMNRMSMTDLLRSSDAVGETLWALSYGGGVARIRDDGISDWRAERGELPSEAIYSAVETRSATGERIIWMASRAGLLRFRGERVDVFTRRHGLPSDAVRGVKVQRGSDGVDTLWIATEGGLARATLSDSPWATVSLHGANENGIFGVLVEPNGRGGERLWIGSAKEGLAMLDDGQWRQFNATNGRLPAGPVRGLWRLQGSDGRPRRLLSLVGQPLFEITETLQVRAVPTPWPVREGASVNHMLSRRIDGATEWWAATSHAGVFRLRDGEWRAFATLGNDAQAPVNWLAEQVDAAGRPWLWAADALGIARFDGQRWERLPGSLELPDGGFRSLTVVDGATGPVLWASSTHRGVLRLDVGDPLVPRRLDDSRLPAPPDPTVYSVLPDSQGRLYVCTNNGVQQLIPRFDGSYGARVFRRRDGLVHDECNTNAQWIDDHDRYWVGTLGGLGMFDPDAQPRARAAQPSPLHFTGLRVDGEAHVLPGDLQLVVPAGSRELRIEYSLLTGQRERESQYRTHLLGFAETPGPWTSEHSRSFSGLPPGDYTFRVEARDFASTHAVPIELALSVAPLWWQQWWLQLLAAVSLLLLAAGVVMGFNRRLRARQKLLRRLVAERTQDLHDANLRLTELSYLDPLTGVANRRRLIEAMRNAMDRARNLDKPIGLVMVDVDRFKPYNDKHGHLAGDTALRAIANAIDSAMREQDLVARFGGEEFACLMIDADLATVTRVAERMRVLVEALPPRSLGNDTQTLTISAGVLSCVPAESDTPEDLLHQTDLALYAAKAAGRNRIAVASDPGHQ